jgi:DNA replication protein DnaC
MEIEELIKAATKIYGNRKTHENNCTFCNSNIGSGYCICVESALINRIARRINSKVELLERYNRVGADFKKSIIESSNVPLKYASITIAQYKVRTKEEEKILQKIGKYQDELISNYLTGKNLLLMGNYGTAKSFFMSALCNYCIREKILNVKYINIVDLVNEVNSTYEEGSLKTKEQVINRYASYDFLFLDDIDKKENPSDATKEIMYNIINTRYDNILPTVISSNNSLEALDINYYGEAVISRLGEKSEKVYFNSENERLKSA